MYDRDLTCRACTPGAEDGAVGPEEDQDHLEVCTGYGSPLEETLLDFSLYGFYISLLYEVPSGLHTMDQPRHTDEGMCGHARAMVMRILTLYCVLTAPLPACG